MNTQSNAESTHNAQGIAPAAMSPTRPMYWSVRRELWENRSIYLAPLAAAALVLFGFLLSAITLPSHMRNALTLDPEKQHAAIVKPYDVAAALIMLTAVVVAVFYCLDALNAERRDRSILFWKSLPVSDLTTVLSKAFIPIVVLQLLSFAIVVVSQTIMLLLNAAVLLGSGLSVAALWTQLSLPQMSLMLLYHIVTVHMLWYAPIYCWMLLVSAWARRAAFLWAFLPVFAILAAEKIAFNTMHFGNWLKYRLTGGEAVVHAVSDGTPMDPFTHITLGKFLSTPGLWLGLIVAAAFLFAAARLRRSREPI